MSVVSVPLVTPRPIGAHRFARNGFPVDPSLIAKASEGHNIALAHRGKEVFRSAGSMDNLVAETQTKWRFAFRSSPYITRLRVMMLLQGPFAEGNNGTATLSVTDGGGFSGSVTANHSGLATTNTDPMNGIIQVIKTITIPANTLLFGAFTTLTCRLLAACVWEDSPEYDTVNGYVQPTYQSGQNILAGDRAQLATLSNLLVRRGGAHLFNFTCPSDTAPRTNSTFVFKNIIDGVSTGFGAADPGWRLDLRYKATRRASTVRCVLAHYGNNTSASGVLRFFNENGSEEYVNMVLGSSVGWTTAVVNLPATFQRFIAMDYAGAGTTNTYAVSLFTEGV
jgi:hypothetical protein